MWAEGSYYVGEIKGGQMHGEGTETFGDGEYKGDTYVGQYKDDKKHGFGKYTFADGEVAHDGEWENG